MSPKLRGEDIPRAVGTSQQRTTVREGEVRVECSRAGCDWSTVREERHAWSAAEAHRLRHAKGMVP